MRSKPGAMSCRKVGKILQSQLDGELDDNRREQVAAHLAECERCGLEAEVLEGVRLALRRRRKRLPVATASALRDFSNRLIHDEDPPDGSGLAGT